jgi:hypothetical protein
MKDSPIEQKVLQKLKEFESLGNIQTPEGWNQSLMNRLGSVKPFSATIIPSARFAFAVLFLILINIGFVLTGMIRNSSQTLHRDRDLGVISVELLSNPVSIND